MFMVDVFIVWSLLKNSTLNVISLAIFDIQFQDPY